MRRGQQGQEPLEQAHKSVLLRETLEWLRPEAGTLVVDGTLGAGGHAAAILQRSDGGKLIGFDKDPRAIEEAKKVLDRFGERAMIIRDDFKNIAGRLKEAGIRQVDGMLLDLGVSSMQLDQAGRGFSFKADGPLDMRMDPQNPLTAREIVNTYPKNELRDLLGTLGEERYAGRIAERIFETRSKRRIDTTGELASIIAGAVPRNYRYGRIHPATRSFQALRIAVNREIETLELFLSQAAGCLAAGGRLVIISFHSLEDRLVKVAFKEWQARGLGRILTKKPVGASEEEVLDNPRARSAKMRVFEKVRED